MAAITQSNRYIQAIQLKEHDLFTAEQIFMGIILDTNATNQERFEAANQIFDIAIRDENPNYAMYIWEFIMDLQHIQVTDQALYPQFQQLLILLAKKYTIKISIIRNFETLMAFHASEFPSRRILLFISCMRPFLMQPMQEQIDLLIDKTKSLQDDFKNIDLTTVEKNIL